MGIIVFTCGQQPTTGHTDITSDDLPQGWSGACLHVRREWALSAGSSLRRWSRSEVTGPVQKDYGFRPVSICWWAHGNHTLQDSNHHCWWVLHYSVYKPNFLHWAHFILTLCLFQWEVQSQCQSVPHLPRRRSTIITDCTWRPCPSYSMNTRSAVDLLKVTSFESFRHFSSTWRVQLCFFTAFNGASTL